MDQLQIARKGRMACFRGVGPFQATARPLFAGTVRRAPGAVADASTGGILGGPPEKPTLAELADASTGGPYFVIASWMDAVTLCRADASCRVLRDLNRANQGPWRTLGALHFYGMELEQTGVFEPVESRDDNGPCKKNARMLPPDVDWKGRYRRFREEVPTFRQPFTGTEIGVVRHPDEVAYCRCRLRTDLLDDSNDNGVYMEVEVSANPDNLSLAVVDFEAGGRSSVTFSPDTGAVIRERKVREAPRKVEGAYIQPLATTPPGRRFEGTMGLYLRAGHLAFFRRHSRVVRTGLDGEQIIEPGAWESTGFITDLTWAEGRCLTPCLAFRDEGSYKVRVVRVGPRPPHVPQRLAFAYDDDSWSGLDWEAGQQGAATEV